jgi:hypothetical protein
MPRSYLYALICLIVGCVPPQTYPGSQYQQPSQQSGYDGDYGNGNGDYGNDDNSYDGDYGNGNYGNGNGDYGNGGGYDSGNGGDSRNSGGSRNRGGGRAAPRATGQWNCIAEASLGTALGNGPMNYSVKSGYGTASTRDEAVTLALKECGETVNVSILIADDMRTETGTCALSRCTKI